MIKKFKKIEKAEIIVGIPSYNEAETIGFVVKQVNSGLKKYFSNKSAIIVNVDNNSTDETKKVFLSSRTSVPKIYLSTRAGISGKGYNFYNLFNFIKERQSRINIVVDADLRSIGPEWIKKMATPIIKGYDFIVPVYSRNKKDGLVTNNFCYPLIYGLCGWNISQPIGGDFSFSLDMVNHWLSKKWSDSIYRYGIDVFMTTEAILNDFKICQVDLGRKVHRGSGPGLRSMFLEVAEALFGQLIIYKRFWRNSKVKRPKIFYKNISTKPQPLSFDYRNFYDIFRLGFKAEQEIVEKVLKPENFQLLKKNYYSEKHRIYPDLWSKIIYDFLHAYENLIDKNRLIEVLEILAFGRFFSHINSIERLNFKQAEKEVFNQAKTFRKNRSYLLNQQ